MTKCRWGFVLFIFGFILFALLLSGCESMTEPKEVPLEPDRFGYWHSDGAQEVCFDEVCLLVYAHIEIAQDSTCAFEIRREGSEWSEIESLTCEADIRTWMAIIRHTSQVNLPNLSYVIEASFQVSADDPEWNVLRWDDLRLIRREP